MSERNTSCFKYYHEIVVFVFVLHNNTGGVWKETRLPSDCNKAELMD